MPPHFWSQRDPKVVLSTIDNICILSPVALPRTLGWLCTLSFSSAASTAFHHTFNSLIHCDLLGWILFTFVSLHIVATNKYLLSERALIFFSENYLMLWFWVFVNTENFSSGLCLRSFQAGQRGQYTQLLTHGTVIFSMFQGNKYVA